MADAVNTAPEHEQPGAAGHAAKTPRPQHWAPAPPRGPPPTYYCHHTPLPPSALPALALGQRGLGVVGPVGLVGGVLFVELVVEQVDAGGDELQDLRGFEPRSTRELLPEGVC